ncbi:MAG: SusC/RagA family TonB-linked outer membrane protein [Bacteroidetes bacterium]|nr:SusC/RagA family TonB-linked outer membrane protein [Bacteroidota bacterium]
MQFIRTAWSFPRRINQTVLIMKWTMIWMTAFLLNASAKGLSQTITFDGKNVALEKVFQVIKKQTNYSVICTTDILDAAHPVTIRAAREPLDSFLTRVLSGQSLQYAITRTTIVISRKAQPPTVRVVETNAIVEDAPGDITVYVYNAEGLPLEGASVMVKGQKKGASTDFKGKATVTGADGGSVLVVSFTGYTGQEVPVKKRASLAVVLQVSTSLLDETQVIAYGKTSRRLNTGNVSTVKSADIEKQPVNNPLMALAGRMPGVYISQASGYSGAGVTVRIQGINSIAGGNDPFYVVDGVPYTSQLLPSIGNVFGASASGNSQSQQGNPLSFINPADIESIDVLKDADATAIYGSRAANGAILITTKKGKAGKTKADISFQQGFGKVTRMMPMLNTQQYLEMRREAFSNDGLPVPTTATAPTSSNFDLTIWDSTRYTDWQKELIGGTAQYTDAQAALSGGMAQTTFRLNTGYHRETTVFPVDYANDKKSLGLSLNHRSVDQRFSLLLNLDYLNSKNKIPQKDYTITSVRLPPNAPALYKSDGTLNWARIPSGTDSLTTFFNPLAQLLGRVFSVNTDNLISNMSIGYKLANHLELKSTFGYTSLWTDEISTIPLTGAAPELRPTGTRSASFGKGRLSSWIVEPQLTYNRSLGAGRLELLVGSTLQQRQSKNQILNGSGFSSDQALMDVKSAATVTVTSTIDNTYKYAALYGRINYNWQERYILNLTARRDGTSRFGPENQYHNFGAVGAAWILSNESFFKKIHWVNFAKVRVSYGTTGNDQIPDYAFMSLYSTSFVTVPLTVSTPYQGIPVISPSRLYNPFLQWETTRKLQAGIDLGLFQDRILLGVGYYRNESSNQLIDYALPMTAGFGSISRNFPATVQNTGWEMSVAATVVKSKGFQWRASANLTIPRTILTSFPNIEASSYRLTKAIGKSLDGTRAYQFRGVDPNTGLYQFLSKNGSLVNVPDAVNDRNGWVQLDPRWFGGSQHTFIYKDFSLDVFFQFVKQLGLNNAFGAGGAPGAFFAGNTGEPTGNQPVWVMDRWQKPGTTAPIARYTANTASIVSQGNGSAITSDAGYSDASFVRLKNVSFSWQLPEKWIKKAHFQNIRLYTQGQNLLTFTSYKGIDPETRSSTRLPPLKVVTFGIQFTL